MIKFFTVSISLLSFPGLAGDIEIYSEYWENICKVEIVSGKDAPEVGFKTNLSNVEKGFSLVRQNRACYRRSNDPERCDSGLTNWTCQNQFIDGSTKLEIR